MQKKEQKDEKDEWDTQVRKWTEEENTKIHCEELERRTKKEKEDEIF